jgi:hypothetical protein
MGVKVLVNSAPGTRVSINNQTRETIRTVSVGLATTANVALAQLTDVQLIDLQNNDTLVYDSNIGKYVNKQGLPVLNGGSF